MNFSPNQAEITNDKISAMKKKIIMYMHKP